MKGAARVEKQFKSRRIVSKAFNELKEADIEQQKAVSWTFGSQEKQVAAQRLRAKGADNVKLFTSEPDNSGQTTTIPMKGKGKTNLKQTGRAAPVTIRVDSVMQKEAKNDRIKRHVDPPNGMYDYLQYFR